MNILHVIIKYSQQHWGGAEGFIYNVARLHARQGHAVTVATPNVFGDSARETLDGVRVLRFPFFYPSLDRSVDQVKARKGAGLVSLPLLAHVATTRYDIVHLHLHNAMSTSLAYLLKALGQRFVLHIHSPYLEEPEFFNASNTIYRQTSTPWKRDSLFPVYNLARVLFPTRRSLALARLAAALEGLISAGVSIVEGWELAANASGSPALRRVVLGWRPLVDAGRTPAEIMRESRVFPEIFASQYASGEISGKLDEVLQRLHRYYQDEGSRKLHAVAAWAPRLFYFAVVLMVAYRVVSFYSNYFKQILDAGGI